MPFFYYDGGKASLVLHFQRIHTEALVIILEPRKVT